MLPPSLGGSVWFGECIQSSGSFQVYHEFYFVPGPLRSPLYMCSANQSRRNVWRACTLLRAAYLCSFPKLHGHVENLLSPSMNLFFRISLEDRSLLHCSSLFVCLSWITIKLKCSFYDTSHEILYL